METYYRTKYERPFLIDNIKSIIKPYEKLYNKKVSNNITDLILN
jgi:hypothetical protein